MGLDAFVWCNCIAQGKLKTPHPFPELLIVHKSGSPDVRTDDEEKQLAHERWEQSSPCEHKNCCVVSHYLGNIGLIALLRKTVASLSDDAETEFPVLWLQVIYSGSHCGDFLEVAEVKKLEGEIALLRSRDFSVLKKQEIKFLRDFLTKMNELIAASLAFKMPIAF